MQPLHISPPRFPPPVSPPHKSPSSLRGSDPFTHITPTRFDVRNRTHSLSDPKPAGTTAQDLLNGVLGIKPPVNDPAPAASILSGLGGSVTSVWSPANDGRHPPIGQQRHQRSVSQFSPSLPPGTRPGNGMGNGLGPITGGSPFLPSSGLPQSSSQPSWQLNQLSQQNRDIIPHPGLSPIGHHRTQSSGVSSYLTSPNSIANDLFNPRPTQPIPGTAPNPNPTGTLGGLGGGFPSYPLGLQGLSPTSQKQPYNLLSSNPLGIQGSNWES